MLNELRIKNFVIIDDLTISFRRGLNILSGETGAGKSILIDALSGVLGEKMTIDMIRTGFEKATLECEFDISNLPGVKKLLLEMGIEFEDEILILRRELFSSGRGRCYINSIHVPISKLKSITEYLIDIHGQNEHQNIIKISKHRELLDSFAESGNLVNDVRNIHDKLHNIKNKLDSFEIDEKEKARRIEYNKFAINEIDSAGLKPGEEDELKNESKLLSNAEKLFTEINNSSNMMNQDGGVIQKLKIIEQSLSTISEYDTEISNMLEAVKESLYSLEDVSVFFRDYEKSIDYSSEKINQVEERLSLLSSLKKKYGDTIDEILEYYEKAKKELDAISSSEEELEKLNDDYKKAKSEAKTMAIELSETRKIAAQKLEIMVMNELKDLGMGGTAFKVSIDREISPDGEIESDNKKYMLYPHGLDKIEFLISANEGEDLKQLRKVASGGEMSRIMLALKNVILSKDIVESLIFDEVDAGIGGKIADIVGKKLKTLSKDRQVLLITHLPQIAAMSDHHLFVQKSMTNERVSTVVKQLNNKEKIKEVARMLAGEKITELSIKHADELIKMAGSN
ncbi:DNA repair protein RecN [Spirochaetota bacterium]